MKVILPTNNKSFIRSLMQFTNINLPNILHNNTRKFSLSLLNRENNHKQEIEYLLRLGMKEYSVNNWSKAKEYFSRANQIDPNNLDLVNRLSNTFDLMDKFQEGLDGYTQIINKYENCFNDDHRILMEKLYLEALLGAGNCIKSMNRDKEAITYYTKLINFSDYPMHIFGYYNRASCYLRLKKYREALNDFEQVIQVFERYGIPKNRGFDGFGKEIFDISICLFFRAECYLKLNQYEKALSDLNHIIHSEELYIISHVIRNNIMIHNNDFTYFAYKYRAQCYIAMRADTWRAIESIDKCIEIVERCKPLNTADLLSDLYLDKAETFLNAMEINNAYENLLKSFRLHPINEDLERDFNDRDYNLLTLILKELNYDQKKVCQIHGLMGPKFKIE